MGAGGRRDRRCEDGHSTVGTQRQYTGTARRIENAQVAIYLSYAGRARHAMIDQEFYLPRCWTNDPARCAAARVPEDLESATKPALAGPIITRALDAQVPARWVTVDESMAPTRLCARSCGPARLVRATIGCDRRARPRPDRGALTR